MNRPYLQQSKPKRILNFLVPEPYVNFDLTRPPGISNPGGGVAIKYARVEEAGGDEYECRRIAHVEDIEGDIVFAEWQWFSIYGVNLIDQMKDFLSFDGLKIVYGSECHALGWARALIDKLVEGADAFTHNCEYQRNLYSTMGIYSSRFVCDPISEEKFVPTKRKQKRIVCLGQVGEMKRSRLLVELFGIFRGTSIQTAYLGGAGLWGKPEHARKQGMDTQRALEAVCDLYIESTSEEEVASVVNESSAFAHVAHHDVFSGSQIENALAGNITFALTHPVMRERTPYRYKTVEEMALAIIDYPFGEPQHDEDKEAAVEVGMRHGYGAWRAQIADLLWTLRGI